MLKSLRGSVSSEARMRKVLKFTPNACRFSGRSQRVLAQSISPRSWSTAELSCIVGETEETVHGRHIPR